MKIFYDTEFLDDGRLIELISIGLVRDDGAEYYAVNAQLPWTRILQHEWLRAHVVPHLPVWVSSDNGETFLNYDHSDVKDALLIAQEVKGFLNVDRPELWAYYGAYDHVALCQLWGRMIDLPGNVPMYTNDVQQECHRLGNPQLPTQHTHNHHALHDARWTKQASEFLQSRAMSEQVVKKHRGILDRLG